MRAAEKGYSVGVMESGRLLPDAEIPKTSGIWAPHRDHRPMPVPRLAVRRENRSRVEGAAAR